MKLFYGHRNSYQKHSRADVGRKGFQKLSARPCPTAGVPLQNYLDTHDLSAYIRTLAISVTNFHHEYTLGTR